MSNAKPGNHLNYICSQLQPNSLYRAARFANFEGILGLSVPSIILADLLGNKCLLVIDAFPSTLFVSVFQGSLLVIALFRIVSGSDRLVFSGTYAAINFGPPCWCLSEVCNLASPYRNFIKLD